MEIMAKKPEEIGASSMTLDEMRAQTLNNAVGDLGELDCPICKNKGFTYCFKDHFLTAKECSCMAKRKSLRRIRQSGLMDQLQVYTFQAYQTPEEWQAIAKRKAQVFAADPDGRWFVIAGTPGTGKTHLCTAIASVLMEAGREVRYMLWREEAPKLKASVNDRDRYEGEIQKWKKVDVLYIDDFFKGGVTEADVNLAFELLNSRYSDKNAVTIISSEKTLEQILDTDEAIGSRIYERSKGFCIKTPVQNWRLKK